MLEASDKIAKQEFPAYTLVVGNPARPIGKVCRCGRRLFNDAPCAACGFDLKKALAGPES